MECNRWKIFWNNQNPAAGLITKWIEAGEGSKGLTCLVGLIDYLDKHGRVPITSAGLALRYQEFTAFGENIMMRSPGSRRRSKNLLAQGKAVSAIALHELALYHFIKMIMLAQKRNYRKALHWCLRIALVVTHDEAGSKLIGWCIIALGRYLFLKASPLAAHARKKQESRRYQALHCRRNASLECYKALGRYAEAEIHLGNGYTPVRAKCDTYRKGQITFGEGVAAI